MAGRTLRGFVVEVRMASLLDWLVKERCVWHAEPLFDRDLRGEAVFRCPRCMTTWPILPGQNPHRRSRVVPFDTHASHNRAPKAVHAAILASSAE